MARAPQRKKVHFSQQAAIANQRLMAPVSFCGQAHNAARHSRVAVGLNMNKTTQTILLTLVVSIGIGARLSILGWLFILGIGSALIFGISHLIVHFYSMNYLAKSGNKSLLLIILSHLSFLGIFLFQSDFDDSRSYSVLGHTLGVKSETLDSIGFPIVGVSIISLIVISFLIVKKAKRNKTSGNNVKYIIPSTIASLILPIIFINVLYANKDLQKTKELETTGEFNSISRALSNPESVEIIKINPYQTRLTSFPLEIMELPNVKIIDLNEQRISTIPDGLNKLEYLEVLNLLDNNISEIPESICECKNLKELRVGGQIEEFPDCLKKMKNLKHLSIQSNSVNELMEELRDFEYLETSHFYLKDGILDKVKLSEIRKVTGIKHKY
ncbi:leucine-rich repeat domain-containing protein [Allomuricauda sp. CP2A]|uniref:leucine-rich repeat domain-containing protein n=1 Tax=Allomuricauda sp. CP2A TaxID=1848189 RepID=UPI0008375EAD|nr:leucine-rich repeat domain-containing protein [Muricauda sp. CP2A]